MADRSTVLPGDPAGDPRSPARTDPPWIFRTYAGHSTAVESNALYRKNLAKGQTGLSVAFDLPTQTGYDSDHPLAKGEVGKVGVPISHVGDMVPVITGIALTFKIRREPRVALTWIGDGSTKTAAAHEGTNFAAVQRVPAIFIIENNQVALGTRLEQHHLPADFKDWPASYGVWGATFDGNNVLDAYAATRIAAERCRSGNGPALLIAETFRMGGHATHDEREARRLRPAAAPP